MVELTYTAYVNINAKDQRYLNNPKWLRVDVLRALALIRDTHRRLNGDYEEPYVTIYKDKNKITIKYRWPTNYNGKDVIFGVLRKDDVYETVLGMVMEEFEDG